MVRVIRTILAVLFIINCIVLVVVVLLQPEKDHVIRMLDNGLTSETYWDKNKRGSVEGNLKNATRIMAILFIVLAVVLNIKF